jgi:hypothetical protein
MKTAPEPELLTRDDIGHGQWDVSSCDAKRGLPKTNVSSKTMIAPDDDNEKSRAIRAHEMMHAKFSPQNDLMDKWEERGIATMKAMVIAEELRINHLCNVAGFDMKALGDDGDTADGERLAMTGSWEDVLLTAISYAETGSLNKFLVGVRRHKPEWAKAVQICVKNIVKQYKKFNHASLTSTAPIRGSELTPYGFSYTERIAEYIDRLVDMEPPEEQPEGVAGDKADSESSEANDGGGKTGTLTHSNIGVKPTDFEEWKDKLKVVAPTTKGYGHTFPQWTPLRLKKMPMTVTVQGNLGRKKICSAVGKNPRRFERLLTDPEKRIFDRSIKGTGGVVVIDCSGSMQLSKKEVREIVENAPGCTVLAYSDLGDKGVNAWILAEKGKMTSELPQMGAGNGVDFPALEWAVKNRKRSSEKIVFVTDGGVCGENDSFDHMLSMQCIKYCIANNIKVVPDAPSAIALLKDVKKGGQAKSKWPVQFKMTYRSFTMGRLPS